MTSVKISRHIQKLFLLFLNFLSYLECMPSFQLIHSNSVSRKKYDGVILFPSSISNYEIKLRDVSVGIELIKLTQPSDTLNYKPFFKHCILQTILHVFLLFIFV